MLNKLFASAMKLACCMLLLLAVCGTASAGEAKDNPPRRSNPAAEKCVSDGYSLQPIVKNGVTADHFCVNKKNGTRCKVWKYFRGKCRLD